MSGKNVPRIVDLRSDTISKPSASMKRAMVEAELGDDAYREDPTVIALENKAAKLTGKEAAIFVTSGTMGNLIAVMNHCEARGCEAYCGESSHMARYEQAAAAQIASVQLCGLANDPRDGSFDLGQLERRWLRPRDCGVDEPRSRLVCVENTMRGRLVPQAWIARLAELARRRGDLRLHLDGARLWNAAVASGRPLDELCRDFDSVTFCLSKGLGCPVGALLCGSREFVERARRRRKALGGAWRQAGVLAAAGLVALREIVPLLKDDHARARRIAEAIDARGSRLFSVDLAGCQTNWVLVKIDSDHVTPELFVARLGMIREGTTGDDETIVKASIVSEDTVRLLLYYEIDDEMTAAAIQKITLVIEELDACDNDIALAKFSKLVLA
ncbi:hypothetical protein TKK_0005399 [Trichogramma kaykai]